MNNIQASKHQDEHMVLFKYFCRVSKEGDNKNLFPVPEEIKKADESVTKCTWIIRAHWKCSSYITQQRVAITAKWNLQFISTPWGKIKVSTNRQWIAAHPLLNMVTRNTVSSLLHLHDILTWSIITLFAKLNGCQFCIAFQYAKLECLPSIPCIRRIVVSI